MPRAQPSAAIAAPVPFLLQPRAILLAFILIATGFVVALAGSCIDLVAYRLLTDGVLTLVWLIAAGGIGAVFFRFAPPHDSAGEEESSTLSLRFVTAIAIGLGILSLAMLGLGLIGFPNRAICVVLIAIGLLLAIVKGIRLNGAAREGPHPNPLPVQRGRESKALSAEHRGKELEAPPAKSGKGESKGIPLPQRGREVVGVRRSGWSWLWLLAAPFLGIGLAAAMVPPGVLWGDEPNGYDVLEYHLQIPREWYDAGRMTALDHNAFSYFPQGVEMHYLLAMELRGGPWAGMYLAQLMHLAFVALSVFAVYAGARALGAGVAGATVAGVSCAIVPWMTLLAPIAYNEGGLLLYGTLAIAWAGRALALSSTRQKLSSRSVLARYLGGISTWRSLTSTLRDDNSFGRRPIIGAVILAGVCAGFACGVKLTAVPILIVAIPIALLFAIDGTRSLRRIILGSILFIVVALVVFAPWMARNIAWAGNPLFPEAQAIFGDGPFTPVQSKRWTQAHSATSKQHSFGAHLDAARSQIMTDWRYGFVLIPLGSLAGVLSLRRREARFIFALLVLQFIFWIGFTHLQGRFFILAIPICGLLIGLIDQPRWLIPIAVLIAVQFAIALWLMLARFGPMAGQFRAARAFGIEDLSFMIPADAVPLIAGDTPLALVGDAKAFAYQVPMSRLMYRTVFDVNARPNEPIATAWLGAPPPPESAIVIDPPEIERLSRTYFEIPNLSPDDPAYGRMPFVIPPRPRAPSSSRPIP
jgi:hypothetical protein